MLQKEAALKSLCHKTTKVLFLLVLNVFCRYAGPGEGL